VFLQVLAVDDTDLQIPDRPFTFGQLIRAQAEGDASVLADHGRPVLSLTLRNAAESLPVVISALK
jgi:glucose-6-phosphate isomerase